MSSHKWKKKILSNISAKRTFDNKNQRAENLNRRSDYLEFPTLFLALEQRFMFDGAAVTQSLDTIENTQLNDTSPVINQKPTTVADKTANNSFGGDTVTDNAAKLELEWLTEVESARAKVSTEVLIEQLYLSVSEQNALKYNNEIANSVQVPIVEGRSQASTGRLDPLSLTAQIQAPLYEQPNSGKRILLIDKGMGEPSNMQQSIVAHDYAENSNLRSELNFNPDEINQESIEDANSAKTLSKTQHKEIQTKYSYTSIGQSEYAWSIENSEVETDQSQIPSARYSEHDSVKQGMTKLTSAIGHAIKDNERPTSGNQLVVIDSSVEDTEALLRAMVSEIAGEKPVSDMNSFWLEQWLHSYNIHIEYLNINIDGIFQLDKFLESYDNDLDALHILSHGSDGALILGNSVLDSEKLDTNSTLFRNWSNAFTERADILIYGCNVAASSKGQNFVEQFAVLTGTDVGASTDLTGSTTLSGNWVLEYNVGILNSNTLVNETSGAAYLSILAEDYSDAPATFGDAQHTISPSVYLGTGAPDADAGSLASTNADGDDLDGTDDENGVILPFSFKQGDTATISVSVNGAGGLLQAWIDWDRSGTFDAGEQVAVDLADGGVLDTNTSAGFIDFDVSTPMSATTGPSFARFRWSTDAGLDVTTAASDGEVEDYQVPIHHVNAFPNDGSLYQIRGAFFAPPTVLQKMDITGPTTTFSTVGSINAEINGAWGVWTEGDGLAYGLASRGTENLYRVDALGNITDLGAPSSDANSDAGDVLPDGRLITITNFSISEYDISSGSPNFIEKRFPGWAVGINDIAYNPRDGFLYGIDEVSGQVSYIDLATDTMTTFGVNTYSDTYGAVWFDAFGVVLYAFNNDTGEVQQIDIGTNGSGTGIATTLSTAPGQDFNDGLSLRGAPPFPTGSISGTVFSDDDSSGGLTGTDTLYSDISVELWDDNGTPGNAADDTFYTSTQTAVNGSYSFSNVLANLTWRVELIETDPDAPTGLIAPTPDPITGIVVAANTLTADQNFMYTIPPSDKSDAPIIYGDASHIIVSSLYLGAGVPDIDSVSLASSNADGDDLDGVDDEDGVSSLATLTSDDTNYSINFTAGNTTGSTANVVAWIDFDGDGAFQTDEFASTTLANGGNSGTINWSGLGTTTDINIGSTFLRLRITTDAITATDYATLMSDGEVEDYELVIEDAVIWSLTGDTSVLEGNSANYVLSLGGVPVGVGVDEDVDINLSDITTNSADYANFLTALDTAIGAYTGNGSYTRIGNTIRFTGDGNAAGDLSIDLGANDDDNLEGDESYNIALSNVVTTTGATIGTSNTVTTTLEDEELDRVQSGDIVSRIINPGANAIEGFLDGQFTVELYDNIANTKVTNDTGAGININHTVLPTSTATTTTDFTPWTFTINDSDDSEGKFILVTHDVIIEGTETIDVQLQNSTVLGETLQADTSNDTSTLNINDNEPPIEWELTGSTTVLEGANAAYTLSLGAVAIGNGIGESVDINLSDITTDNTDYANFLTALDTAITAYTGNGVYARSGNTITFTGDDNAAGDLIISLATVNDDLLEGDESYTIALSNVVSTTGATLHTNNAVTTTLEDEELDRVQSGDIVSRITASDDTGTEGSDNAEFTVLLYDTIAGANVINKTGSTITIDTTILGTSTTTGTDYTLASFDIVDGASSGTVAVTVIDDTIVEIPETLDVQINDTVGILGNTLTADIGNNTDTVTINDNEPPIEWELTGSTSVLEGANAAYTLSLGAVAIGNGIGESVDINLSDITTDSTDYANFLTALDTAITAYTGNGSYARSGNTITFTGDDNAAGDLIISLATVNDDLLEGDESYTIALSNVLSTTGATLHTNNAVTTTLEDEELDRVQSGDIVSRITASDDTGTEGSDDAEFTVLLYDTIAGANVINKTGSTITIDTTILGTSTTTGTDYTLASFDIVDGASSGTVAVTVIDDTIVEIPETLDVQINDTVGILGNTLTADIGNNTDTVTINDNEPPIEWELTGSTSVLEGANAAYTLSLGGVAIGNGIGESVDINLSDITTDSADYANFLTALDTAITAYTGNGVYARSGNTITFTGDDNAAGDLIISLATVNDDLLEGDESYTIALSNVLSTTGATLHTNNTVTTTLEDQELDRVQSGDIVSRIINPGANAIEGFLDGQFTVELYDNIANAKVTNDTGAGININHTVLPTSTATTTTDFTPWTFTINDGDDDVVATILITHDVIIEGTETIDVQLQNTTVLGETLQADTSNDTSTLNINDNEPPIEWELTGSTSVLEGANAAYTLSLGGVAIGNGIGESVDINLSDITTDSTDYANFLTALDTAITAYTGNGVYARSGNTITFTGDDNAAGDLIISLATVNDDLLEGDESYTIALSNVLSTTGATLHTNNAVTTTLEDEELDKVQSGDIVSRITASDDTGTEGSDDAEFTVLLYDTIAGANVINKTGSTITIDTTILGTSTTTGTDYTLASFDIVDGASSGTVAVTVIDDTIVEIPETLDVQINDTVGILGNTLTADIGNNTDTVTINDNEPPIEWELTGSTTVLEGANAAYTLSLGAVAIGNGIGESVDINLSDITTDSTDYANFLTALDTAITAYTGNGVYARSGNTITFTGDDNAAGDLIISLATVNDDLLEGDESYTIALSNVLSTTGATLHTNNAVTTTLEDEELDKVQSGDIVSRITASDDTGTEGSDDAEFTVLLYDTIAGANVINKTGSTITIDTTILGTSTTTGTDYTLASFDIVDGASSGTVAVTVIDDTIVEIPETLDVQINDTVGILGNTLTADIGNNTDTVTINDNEPPIEWELTGSTSVLEGANAAYTLSLGAVAIGNGIGESVDINLSDITTDSTDYANFLTALDTAITAYTGNGSYARSGNTITFTGDDNAAGDLIISLATVNDDLLEGDESYTIALSNVLSTTGATLHTNNAVTTTLEDEELDRVQSGDIVSRITASDDTGTEGSDDAEFTVLLYDTIAGANVINKTGSTITIDTTILGTSTTTGTDYTLASFDIVDGASSGTVAVTVIDDTIVEIPETLDVQINDTVGILGNTLTADIGNNTDTVTINDNEPPIEWELTGSTSVLEGANAAYTLSLGGVAIGNGIGESVDINLSDITTDSADYANFLTALDTAITAYTGNGVYARSGNTITFTGDDNAAGDLIISLATVNDDLLEGDESYTIALSNVLSTTGATLHTNNAVTTTLEDEELDRVQSGDIVSQIVTPGSDGTEGGSDGSFSILLFDTIDNANVINATGSTITLNHTVQGTSTASGTDYTLASFDIADGASTGNVIVSIVDDAIIEVTETLDVQINDIAILGTTLQADTSNQNSTLNIIDNEGPIVWTLTGDSSVIEGNNANYILSLGGATVSTGINEDIDINLTDISTNSADYANFLTALDTAIGAYTGNGSYTRIGNTIRFTGDGNAAGDLSIDLGTTIDNALEGDESYDIALSNVVTTTGATIGAANTVTTTLEDQELDRVQSGDIVSRIINPGANAIEGFLDGQFTVELYDNIANTKVTNDTGAGININHTVLPTSTATTTTDFTPWTFTINDGDDDVVATILITHDVIIEGTETIDVQLQNTTVLGETLQADTSNDTSTLNINDNEPPIEWELTGSTSVLEGANAAYTLSLGGVAIGNGIGESVDISLSDITTDSTDYANFLTALDTAMTAYTGNGVYARSGNTITFTGDDNAAGDLIISLATVNDDLLEGDESYTIALSNVLSTTGATLHTNNAVTTTLEDEELDRVQSGDIVSRITASDDTGTEGSDNAEFTVLLYDTIAGANVINKTGSTITIDTTILGTSTTTGTDYTLASFDIVDGASSGTVAVTVIDDTIVEIPETLDVQINDTVGILGNTLTADIGNNTDTVTINDNEPPIEWELTGSTTVLEGANAAYTLSLGGVAIGNGIGESVDINLSDITTDNTDYANFLTALDTAITAYTGNGSYARSGNTITFTGDDNAAGDLIISLATVNDDLLEGDESYTIALSNVLSTTGATLHTNNAVTTTLEDEELDRVQSGDIVSRITASDDTGTEGSDDAEFTVLLYDTIAGANVINKTGSTIAIDTTILGTSTTTATDYTLASFDIVDGASSGTVAVTVIDDTIVEIPETLDVQINDTVGILGNTLTADIGNNTDTVTINDNEPPIEWELTGSTSVLEGANAAYTLSLGGVAIGNGLVESVDINLSDITTDSADYANFLTALDTAITAYTGNGVYARSGNTITFTGDDNAAGDLIISLATVNDDLLEGDESYTIALSNVLSTTGATLHTNNAVTTTLEDEELDKVQSGDIVSRITASDDTGTEGSDDAEFTVLLYDTIAGANVINKTGSTITIDTTILGTSTTTGTDYTLASFDIVDGASSGTVAVTVIDDTIVEAPETLDVQINDTAGILGATLTADIGNNTDTVTINDNEPPIEWELTGSTSVLEGANAAYTLSLGGVAIGNGIGESVDINLSDITTDSADYANFLTALDTAITAYTGNGVYARSGNTITFTGDDNAAGDLIISLATVNDDLLEGDESYTIALSNVLSTTGATLHTNNAVTTTLEDEELDRVQSGDIVSQIVTPGSDGTEGGSDGSFSILLFDTIDNANVINATGSTITLNHTVQGTSTASGTDYTLASFDIADGASTGNVIVSIVDDAIIEVTETLDVQINDIAILGTTLQADTSNQNSTLNIIDNEGPIVWTLTGDSSVIEGNNANYILSLGGATVSTGINEDIDINLTDISTNSADYANFLTALDTAIGAYTGNGSYTRIGNTIRFTGDGNAAGDLSIDLGANDDDNLEGDESYNIALSNVVSTTGATIGAANTVTTTLEDEELDRVQSGDIVSRIINPGANAIEGFLDGQFTVELYDNIANAKVTNDTGAGININHTVLPTSTATTTTDFTPWTFTINDGDDDVVATILITHDVIIEGTETIDVQLQNSTVLGETLQADTSNDTSTLNINDNEPPIEWELTGSTTVLEGANAAYTLSLGGVAIGNGIGESVDINLSDITTDSTDYANFLTALDTAITAYTGNGVYARSGNTITFTGDDNAAGDLIISLATVNDDLLEGDESYTIALSNVLSTTGATLHTNNAVTTTLEDEELDKVQSGDIVSRITASDDTGTEGSDDAEFTVLLYDTIAGANVINKTGSTITIDTTILGTSTTTGTDYTLASFDIVDGASSGTVAVTVIDDTIVEIPETLDVQINDTVGILGNTLTADIGNNTDTVTINDNEPPIEWELTGSTSVLEGANAAYTLSLGGVAIGNGIGESVDISLSDITTDSADYANFLTALDTAITAYTGNGSYARSGNTITFTGDDNAAGDLIISLATVNDDLLEGDESYTIALSNVLSTTGATLHTNNAVTTTLEDEELDRLISGELVTRLKQLSGSVTEGEFDSDIASVCLFDTTANIQVTNATGSDINVNYGITGNASSSDYNITPAIIPNNAINGVISIDAINEFMLETNEFITITLQDTILSGHTLKTDGDPAFNTTTTLIIDESPNSINLYQQETSSPLHPNSIYINLFESVLTRNSIDANMIDPIARIISFYDHDHIDGDEYGPSIGAGHSITSNHISNTVNDRIYRIDMYYGNGPTSEKVRHRSDGTIRNIPLDSSGPAPINSILNIIQNNNDLDRLLSIGNWGESGIASSNLLLKKFFARQQIAELIGLTTQLQNANELDNQIDELRDKLVERS